MKLALTKFGRIDAAELDLRPLTVLVGPNNTNKSWTAYVAYLLAISTTPESLIPTSPDTFTPDSKAKQAAQRVKTLLEEVLGSGRDTKARVSVLRSELSADDQTWTLSTGRNSLARDLGIPVGSDECYAGLLLEDADLAKAIFDRVEILATSRAHGAGLRYTFHGADHSRTFVEGVADADELDAAVTQILSQLDATLRPGAYAFPIERVVTRALLVSDKVEEEDTTLPVPIAQHAKMLDDIANQLGGTASGGHPASYQRLVQSVFGGGEIIIDDRNRLAFRSDGGSAFDLSASASMIRSLASFALYLKYAARPGDLIVIDEPEMNAHPQAQLAMMELFATMVNAGFHLILTTHSPFMVDHLNNLMAASRARPRKRSALARKFMLKTPDAFLDPEQVAVYEFVEHGEKVEVKDVLDRKDPVITTDTFGKWSDKLSTLFESVLAAERP